MSNTERAETTEQQVQRLEKVFSDMGEAFHLLSEAWRRLGRAAQEFADAIEFSDPNRTGGRDE